jgi:hypothetical protein
LIYVENDPALRGIMGDPLAGQPAINVSLSSVSPTDVIAVGGNVLNGIDLGIDLRIGYSFVPKAEVMMAHSVFVHLVSPSVRTPTHWATPPMMGTQ